MKSSSTHVALVVDEFGGMSGLVTLHDIVEHITGEIPTRHEPADPDIVRHEDGFWLLDGMLPIDEFKEFLDLDDLPGEERDRYYTLAGFIISHLDYIPTVTEYFEWNGYLFKIMDMDRTRIDKILVNYHINWPIIIFIARVLSIIPIFGTSYSKRRLFAALGNH